MKGLDFRITKNFTTRFGTDPTFITRAPGRVNLIGEHTDYNDGFVLPLAIDRAIWIALRPRPDRTVRLHSLDYGETAVFSLDDLNKGSGWSEYVKGVAWALQENDHNLMGWEGVMAGDVPQGAGLSSSAALELATARAFQAVGGWEWQPAVMAQLCQKAENEWVGVNCGIMDQMVIAAAKADHALLIDCRSLHTEQVPLPPTTDGGATAVLILDTSTRRGLVDSAYNERRRQCETAAAFFGVKALRDVSLAQFLQAEDRLDTTTRRRARHVITENERTLAAGQAMRQGNARRLGHLMNESHTSLRDDFEVSSPELNLIVELAQAQPDCYGARLTGAGFGGCAVALIDRAKGGEIETAVATAYQQATGLTPRLYQCQSGPGAMIIGDNTRRSAPANRQISE
jgi:galactokinase